METNNETVVPAHYNPNQLVTYKVVENGNATYPTVKVVDLEWDLHQNRSNATNLSQYISKVNDLENRLPDYLEMDAEEIVSDICSIFGLNPTKEIEFEATVRVTGTVDVPLADLKDFSIDDIDLTIDASSWSHNIETDVEIEYINIV